MKLFVAWLIYASLILLTVGLFLGNNSNKPPVGYTPPKPVKNTLELPDSIVRLVDHASGRTFCSGTVVSKKIIITAGHCVLQNNIFGFVGLNKDFIDIRTNDNKNLDIQARAVWATSQLDQGLLRGDFSKLPQRRHISDVHGILDEKSKNSTFTTCGYPMGGQLFCVPFFYENPLDFGWAGRGVLIPGMSGGPTMTDDGTVIGVNVAVQGSVAIISPLYEIDTAINNLPEEKK